jgi:hypothetical protein
MGARVVHAMEDVPFFFLCPDTAGHAYKCSVHQLSRSSIRM